MAVFASELRNVCASSILSSKLNRHLLCFSLFCPAQNRYYFFFSVFRLMAILSSSDCYIIVYCKSKKFNLSLEQIKDISERSQEFVDKLFEESKKLEDYASQADQVQMKSIDEFKKAYEVLTLHQQVLFERWFWLLTSDVDSFFYSVQEQSKSDTEKLIANMNSLDSDHIRRQMDLVSFGLFIF